MSNHRVFISWSGPESEQVALCLRQWLLQMLDNCEPWVSSADMTPGAMWSQQLNRQLSGTQSAVVCLTRDNFAAPWLLFEAGALLERVGSERLVPVLWRVKPTDVVGPLAQYQAVDLCRDGALRLAARLNAIGTHPQLNSDALQERFRLYWPKLEAVLDQLTPSNSPPPERSVHSMLEESLELTRNLHRLATKEGIEGTLATWITRLEEYQDYVDRDPHGGSAAERIGTEVQKLRGALDTVKSATWRP